MNFIGKYTFTMPTPSGERESVFILRNYYDGTLHGSFQSAHGGAEAGRDIAAVGNALSFKAKAGPADASFSLDIADDGSFTGKAVIAQDNGGSIETALSGKKTDITPKDDLTHKIEMKGRALILYCSITRNTEKIGLWFKETFERYGMEVTMISVTNTIDWKQYEGKLYIEDYDVVCLGSPIIGGAPMKAIFKHFSAGANSALEDGVAKNAEKGLSFNAGGAGGPVGAEVKGAPPPGLAGPGGPGGDGPPPGMIRWHRPEYDKGFITWPGGPSPHGLYKPIGIVFTTYGGGFSGSDECLPVLALLKLYLESKDVKVIGKFACCGKEFGPAGLDDGETPMRVSEPPVYYKDAGGNYHAGSFFFHAHSNSKPGPREEAKAKALIADIVEDHFYTSDGKRRSLGSEYISIS